MEETVHIALAANRRYLQGLRVTLVSMLNSCKSKEILQFHVFSDGLTDEDQRELTELAGRFGYDVPIDFRDVDMAPVLSRLAKYNGSHTAYLRLFFAELLPELDWVIWSDVDTIWLRDIAGLWKERDESVSLLWSRDLPSISSDAAEWHRRWRSDFNPSRYGCSGVLLMNLKRMRATDFISRCREFLSSVSDPLFADQGVLNEVCYGDAKFLDDRWDLLNPTPDWRKGIVLHFNGIGRLFNDKTFPGLRPLYEIWFRYREQVVYGRAGAHVCTLVKRIAFSLLGLAYLPRWVFSWLPVQGQRIDSIHRLVYFSWLRKKALW